ncbi:MAG TPA: methylenetetrahydrofolate reductase [Candidatus Onthenecus intestinigallinarum]|uniref:Methylenetetrahydrofolate reductase n=1 Tax=Candidatus Onthenecus intestinigallinarum TaxID=2840875 RepID=A0A9D0Z8H8_9FIRM|nr:methylenetetrahydrofolate reductase [Candidatus Onthenecus intestinigallinarum]
MRISSCFHQGRPTLSFEIFPPKGDLSLELARGVLAGLAPLSPDFVSVTCSAGGSGSSARTIDIAAEAQDGFGLTALAHQTCAGFTRAQIAQNAARLRHAGVENVLALRGDAADDGAPMAYAHASDLIPALRDAGLCVGAACYPEGHIACDSLQRDLQYLKAKEDAGASFFISQLFFDNACFLRFLEKARAAGVRAPILAGVMPILSKSQVSRMIFLCGVSLPASVVRLLWRYESDAPSLRSAGIELAARQTAQLLDAGVDGVHLYTMNHPDIAAQELDLLRRSGHVRA